MRSFLLLLIPLLIWSRACGSHVLSFAPILNSSRQVDNTLPISLRNTIIHQMVQDYDCQVLCRSNGFPLLEEQRYRVFVADNPDAVPYPPAADFLFIGSIKDDGSALAFNLNYTAMTGSKDAKVSQKTLTFRDEAELRAHGAERIVETLTAGLGIERLAQLQAAGRAASRTDSGVWAVLPFEYISAANTFDSVRPDQLLDIAYAALADAAPSTTVVDPTVAKAPLHRCTTARPNGKRSNRHRNRCRLSDRCHRD